MLIEHSVHINAPPERVWGLLVVPQLRARWWSYLDLEPKVGYRFEERWSDEHGAPKLTSGVVEGVEENRKLLMTWADENWSETTTVGIVLSPAGSGTRVSVVHTGWDRLPDGARLADLHRAGWRQHLDSLKAAAESGPGN